MKTPASQFVKTAEASIEYLEYGNAAGVPLLLLHGFPDAPIAWEGVIRELDLLKLRVLVPYLRGFGGTTVLQANLVSGQTAALGADVLRFADALGLQRFDLVGHDWGATATYAACLLAPERVKTMTTLASPYVMYGGKPYPPAQARAHWYQWYFQLEQGRTVMEQNAEAFCEELWRAWSPEWKFGAREFATAAKAWKNEQFAEIVLHYYRMRWGNAISVRGYAELQAPLSVEPKPKITVQATYVQGDADGCNLPDCADEQTGFFTGGYERVMLKGVGHFPHREDSKTVGKVLRRVIGL